MYIGSLEAAVSPEDAARRLELPAGRGIFIGARKT